MSVTGRLCACGRPARHGGRECPACASRRTRQRYAEEGVPEHGYNGYAYGCRCEICRAAKREYMEGRRAEGAALAQQRAEQGAIKAPDHITHGTQYAYYEQGCRCPECIEGGRTWRAGAPAASVQTEVRS